MSLHRSPLAAAIASAILAAPAWADAVITFDTGLEGWTGPPGSVIDPAGGNPGANWHAIFQNFGIQFSAFDVNNPDFATDYTQWPSVTLSVDVKVNSIDVFGSEGERPWVVELRDYDNPPDGYPYVAVWHEFAWVGAAPNWITWSVTIDDTSATALPPGWSGYGAETGLGEPILPADRTFTSVLAGIDEIAFSTLEPGWFFIEAVFDLQLDNISITTGAACPGDFDGDGAIGFGDLLAVLSAWGPCAGCPEDVTHDGEVGFGDLLVILSSWGPCR
jgi:hypothetical protein